MRPTAQSALTDEISMRPIGCSCREHLARVRDLRFGARVALRTSSPSPRPLCAPALITIEPASFMMTWPHTLVTTGIVATSFSGSIFSRMRAASSLIR